MLSHRRLLVLAALAASLVPAATAAADTLPPTQIPQRTYLEGQVEALPVPLRCPTLVDHCDWRFFAYDETATAGADFSWPDAGVTMRFAGAGHGGVYLPMGIAADGIHEGTETFRIRAVLTATGTSGIKRTRVDDQRITILDADPAPPTGIVVARPLVPCVVCAPAQVGPTVSLPPLPGPVELPH